MSNKKIALITGAAQGIGFETAKLFIENDIQCVIADVNEDKGITAQQKLGDMAHYFALDVTDENGWQNCIEHIKREFGQLDILVNCAGISLPGDIENCSFELFKKIQDINVNSVFLGCQYAIKSMKETGGGHIVNIGSTLGIRPLSIHTPYGASKSAVTNITRTAALHCAENKYNIRVNAVHPGAVRTPMFESYLDMAEDRQEAEQQFAAIHPLGRVAEPGDIASAVYFLCSDQAGFITGVSLPVDGGYTAA